MEKKLLDKVDMIQEFICNVSLDRLKKLISPWKGNESRQPVNLYTLEYIPAKNSSFSTKHERSSSASTNPGVGPVKPQIEGFTDSATE